MPRKRHTGEQIICKLKEAEVELAGGHTIAHACRKLGVSEQTLRLCSGRAILQVASGVRWPANRPGEVRLGRKGAGVRKRQVEESYFRPDAGQAIRSDIEG